MKQQRTNSIDATTPQVGNHPAHVWFGLERFSRRTSRGSVADKLGPLLRGEFVWLRAGSVGYTHDKHICLAQALRQGGSPRDGSSGARGDRSSANMIRRVLHNYPPPQRRFDVQLYPASR